MLTTLYKASSPNLPGGSIYLSYKQGQLAAFDVADTKLTPAQLGRLLQRLPVAESEIESTDLSSLKVELVPARTAKDKIKMFCAAYRDFRGVTYQPTQNEVANIKNVPVSADLLRTFFECPLLDFRIGNYVARINVTKDFLKNGRDLATRMPNYYDADFYKKCEGARLVAYQQHLRALGWTYNAARSQWKLEQVSKN